MTIGIPRALLYHRYGVLWETFFSELGEETVLSPRTNKEILDTGERLAVDESCLSSKLFFGHVASLEGACDAVFIPRIADFGESGILCTRFEALYDICANAFRGTSLSFLACEVDLHEKKPEAGAYVELGLRLGHGREESEAAYETARRALAAHRIKKTEEQEVSLAAADGIRVLIVGHEYNLHDEYIGRPILDGVRRLGAFPVCSDAVDLEAARRDSLALCERIPWMMSRELVGAVQKYRDRVDGIILMTAFPCGPDSMVNEMLIRRVNEKPILNLLLDSQDASAGIETRLESFLDIIRFRKEMQEHV